MKNKPKKPINKTLIAVLVMLLGAAVLFVGIGLSASGLTGAGIPLVLIGSIVAGVSTMFFN